MLDAFPGVDIDVTIVWVDVLAHDDRRAAEEQAALFTDARVAQFHDAGWRTGASFRSLAPLLSRGAWDIYMFFDRDARWEKEPPRPVAWMHQLGAGRWLDREHYRPGAELEPSLRRALGDLTR